METCTAGQPLLLCAGPCAIESKAQLDEAAAAVKDAGFSHLRGGAYKLRTRSSSFQGLGSSALDLLAAAGSKYGLRTVSEITEGSQLRAFEDNVDVIQVGARNMYNYPLLYALRESTKPVILKRGFCATYEELVAAAGYLCREKGQGIYLCERGIRTFETRTRFTFDISAIPVLGSLGGHKILADPSHATGDAKLVHAVALGALAAGADGLTIEIHPDPEHALSDGAQSLSLPSFLSLAADVNRLVRALGWRMS